MARTEMVEEFMNSHRIGLFEAATDIGDVGAHGSADLDGSAYTVTGSGYNMWFAEDAFHFVWRKVDGDLALSAAIAFRGEGTDPHRKGCILVRHSLAPDSAYAGISVHGDGLTSLQYRDRPGGPTQEVQSNIVGGARVGIVRLGEYVTATIDGAPAGGSVRLELGESFYVGLGVCSHVRGVRETAVFADVSIGRVVPTGALVSTLETISIATTDRRTVRVFDGHVEAPIWTRDDRLVYDSAGTLYSIPVSGGVPTPIDPELADRSAEPQGSADGTHVQSVPDDGWTNSFPVPSPDGRWMAFLSSAPEISGHPADEDVRLRLLDLREGSFSTLCTLYGGQSMINVPSWSPDSTAIAFVSYSYR